MRKNKSFLALSALGVIALILMVAAGVLLSGQRAVSFQADGYVLDTAKQDDDTLEVVTDQFVAGSSWHTNSMGTISLKDLEGQSVQVEEDSFIHYNDASLSAFADGAIVDMDQVDSGLMTSYNAPAQTVLSSSGDKYVTDNNGYELSFSNVLWKLSDTKYMAVSPTIQIELAGQDSASAEGFVEFTYLEEGIVQLVTKDQAWQVLAAGSRLDLANGMSIYLDTQEIVGGSGSARLTLAGINADGPSNIKIAASDEWVPPTFNITAIDGEDGESGDQGENGEQGQAGSEGTSGDSGKNGESGKDGETGATGATGGSRNNGSSTTGGSAATMPAMNLADLDVTAGSISFKVEVGEGGWELEDVNHPGEESGTVQLLNVQTGAVIKTWTVNFNNGDTTFPSDGTSFSFTELSSDTQYRIVVTSPYHYEITAEDNTITRSGTKAFIDRTVYTDSTGIYLNSVTAEESAVSGSIEVKPYALTSGSANYLLLEVINENGDQVGTSMPYIKKLSEIVPGDGSGWELSDSGSYVYHFTYSHAAGDSVYTDHTYTVKLYTSTSAAAPGTVTDNGVELKDSEEVRTLKSLPTIGKLVANAQTGYFDLYVDGVYVNGMNDTSSVSLWTYYIKDSKGNLVRTLTSKTSDAVQLAVDGESIKYGEPYTATAEVTIYDNEKNVVLPSTEDPRGVQLIMYASGDSFVYYTEAAEADDGTPGTTFNSFTGTLSVVPNQRTILVGGDHDLYTQVENTSGTYKGDMEKVNYQPGLQNTIIPMTGNKKIEFTISKKLLAQASDYVISVYGDYYERFNKDGTPDTSSRVKQGLIGKYVVSTKESMPLYMVLDDAYGDDTLTSSLHAKLRFPSETELKSLTWQSNSDKEQVTWTDEQRKQYYYMLDQIEQIEVTLYKGSAAIESNRQGNVYVISQPNVRTMYDENSDGFLLTESSFGLSKDMISGTYYIKVTAVYDGTVNNQNVNGNLGYKNLITGLLPAQDESNGRFSLTDEVGKVIKADAPLPELPPAETGVAVTPIYNGPGTDSTKMYASQYGLDVDSNLESDTIVGYYMQANYDASCERVDAVTYYIMQSGVVQNYYSNSENFSSSGDPVAMNETDTSQETGIPFKFTIPVLKNGAWTMPSLIVYFGEPEGLKAGKFDSVHLNSTAGYTKAEDSIVSAYGGTRSVNDIYGTLKNENGYNETEFRGAQKDAEGNPVFYHIKKDNTTTAVVCAPELSRGHHYTFAYKARVDMGTGDTFIYPDSSQYHYRRGERQSFLSSPTISVWKQPITADTFLYESGMSGTINKYELKVTGAPDDTTGLAELKTYTAADGLVPVAYQNLSQAYTLNDFFVWKYWLKDPDEAQPKANQAFETTSTDAKLIAYIPPSADADENKTYGMLFFESILAATNKSMETPCAVTVQQRLFKDDDTYQAMVSAGTATEKWNCGDEYNSYSIAYQNSASSATLVSLIGGNGKTPKISRKVDMSALKWDVTMNNNVAELTVMIDPSRTDYPSDMLKEFMDQIMYLDVEAKIGNTTETRRFSSSNGVYSLEKMEDSNTTYRIRWDVTLLKGIKINDEVQFTVHCYYDTGFGTMDAGVLDQDIKETNQITKAPGTDKFEAAYALQNLVDNSYVTAGQVSSEDAWTTSSSSTPGRNPFYELSLANGAGTVEAEDGTGVELFGKQYSYVNDNGNADRDTTWWTAEVPGSTTRNLLMKFYRETGGMKMAAGADLSYTYKKVGYYTFTQSLKATVIKLIPSMTHSSSIRGLTYLDYYVSSGSQNLLLQSDKKIYLKIYDLTNATNPENVTDKMTAQVNSPKEENPLPTEVINGETYYVWTLQDSTDYVIRFSGLKPGTLYGLEAWAYPDVVQNGQTTKGDFTLVADAGAKASDEKQDVTRDNPHFQLETQKSVTLKNVRAIYVNEAYKKKGLEIHFNTDVYEGYKIICEIYPTSTNGKYAGIKPIYTYEEILNQYTEQNNIDFRGDTLANKEYNYLRDIRSYSTGDNTFWIPFPPNTDNKLIGGGNYTVVLRAATEDGEILNTPDDNREVNFEFISDGIAISKGSAYAITSSGRASVDTNKQNVLNLTLLANDPLHQIVDDKYSLFVKWTKDKDGKDTTGANILGINADGKLCWMSSENGANEQEATGITLDSTGSSIWKQKIQVADTETTQRFTLTGIPAGTYEIYTMAQIDLEANGPDTDRAIILTSYKQTAQTVTDNVMEGRIFATTQLADGKWKLILKFSGWQNLDKVTSAMCLVVNTDLTYSETFADCAASLVKDNKIELVLDNKDPKGDYVVTLNMTMKNANGIEVPVELKNREITFSIQ